ncbi:MAG: hypothetical protein OEW24_00215 [Chloroflexota bacterium]|nr:hypothetical protein [Chloroflexota bacterium]
MNRLLALAGLAAHELWISYRLLLLLTLPLLGGLAVGAIPAELAGLRAVDGAARWYAISLCASVGIGAAVVSATLAAERRRGTIAWMAVRAVPRSAVQLAWFVVVGGVMVVGIALGAAAAWLTAIEQLAEIPDAGPLVAATVAAAAAALVVLAGAMIVGALPLPPAVASVLSLLLGVGILASAVVVPLTAPLPTGGLGLLANLSRSTRPIADALQSTGTALVAVAFLLLLAVVTLDRADL